MTAKQIARLKVTLDGVKPAVRRRVEVPLSIRLDRLHLVFQAAMGWGNSHLYEIRAGGIGWGARVAHSDFDVQDAARARLIDVLEDAGTKTLKYLYDFGDGWEHTVKLERVLDAVPGVLYPILIDAQGRCPPEDCGGRWGYADLLEVLANPDDPRHTELTEWAGAPFDPNATPSAEYAKAIEALAKRWAKTPAAHPKKAT
jgi:hypothetical protein